MLGKELAMLLFRMMVLLITLCAILPVQTNRLQAQEIPVTPINTSGFLVTDQGYSTFDVFEARTSAQIAFPTELVSQQSDNVLTSLIDVEIDRNSYIMYLLFSDLEATNLAERQTQLRRITLNNRQSQVIAEQPGAIDFVISPAATSAVITYYRQGDGGTELASCILSILENICAPLSLRFSFGAEWINETELLVSSQYPNSIAIVNTESSLVQPLSGLNDWLISAVAVIPLSNTLLITGSRVSTEGGFHPDQVIIYDLSSRSVQLHPFQPTSLDYIQSSILEVSPDGRYFIIGNTQSASIIEMTSGRILGELSGITYVSWFSNSEHFLAIEVVGSGNAGIIRFDINATTVDTLLSNQTDIPIPIAP
jgi:hypothetical protein